MAKRRDILLDENGNYKVASGDFVVNESDDQHVELLLITPKGGIRRSPAVGVGITRYYKKQSTDLKDFEREATVNLQADGYKATNMTIDANGEFALDYETNY
jgi:hypothetical protein